jgi:U4/U6.U5 tri-snRNP-associated protein 2
MLPLDLPDLPLYKGETGVLVTIPQVAFDLIMKKYDGKKFSDDSRAGTRSVYKILRLPQYLILTFKRFVKNEFFVEKNNTLVQFSLKDIALSSCIYY